MKLEDLVAFIEDSREYPEKYLAPFAEFSAAKYNPKPPQTKRYGFPPKLPDDFRDWLDDVLADIPDSLTIGEIIEVTGYTDTSVNRWIVNGWLKSITTQSGKVIAKDWLVDFYCGYGYKIAKMTEKHVELMVRYFKAKE